MSEFDYEQFKANAIEQLKAGVPLSGKDGVLAPLLENLLNSALEGEMDIHLEGVEREYGNRRNGHMSKQVQTSMGEIKRKASFPARIENQYTVCQLEGVVILKCL